MNGVLTDYALPPTSQRGTLAPHFGAAYIPFNSPGIPRLVPSQLVQAEHRLLDAMTATARGPKRNGVFALWLFVRQCDGLVPPDPLGEDASRDRLEHLERRLSSLWLPAPIRRSLPASLRELRGGEPGGIAVALQQLVAPARDAVGARAAEALALAARLAREAARAATSRSPA